MGEQKEKKKDAEWKHRETRKAADRIKAINPPGLELVRSQDDTVRLHALAAAFLVTVGINFGHLVSLRPAVNTDVCIFLLFCFAALDGRSEWVFRRVPPSPLRVDLREMSERRRSAAALSSRAHAFSVEALIGSNKKRKLRGWEEKELELSMESLATDGEDPAHCLDMDPGQCRRRAPHRSKVRICVKSVQHKAEKKTSRAPSQNMAPLSVTQPEAGLVAVEAPWSPRESGGESQLLAVDLISGPGLILQHTLTQLVKGVTAGWMIAWARF